MSRRLPGAIIGVLLGVGAAVFAIVWFWQPLRSTMLVSPDAAALPPIAPTMQEARHHFARDEFADAERIARLLLADHPQDSSLLLLAGEAATRQGRPEDALRDYSQIPRDSGEDYVKGLWSAGGVLLHLGRLSDSEAKFREVLELDPKNEIAHRNLAFVYSATGRRHDSLPHLLALIQLGVPTLEDLLSLGNPVHAVDHSDYLNFARQAAPNDPLPSLGLASVASFRDKQPEAQEHLQHTLALSPNLPEAQALLGRYFVETNDAAGVQTWNAELTSELERHPEVWYVRGVWAQDHGEADAAIRCYWETVRRNPDHLKANYRLGQLLVTNGHPEWALVFSQRSDKQEALNRVLSLLYHEGPHPARMARAAKLTEELGRLWEAWTWNRMIVDNFGDDATAQAASERLLAELRKGPPRTIAFTDDAMRQALAAFPLPSGAVVRADLPPSSSPPNFPPNPTAASVRFADRTGRLGLQFKYENSDDQTKPGTPIYHQLGGGIWTVDFDRDGWPDIYLSQGARWPPD
jgi:tetratricopeptide (TPR) repeat protein